MNQHETTKSNMIMQLCSHSLGIFGPQNFEKSQLSICRDENPSGESIFQSTKVHMGVSENGGTPKMDGSKWKTLLKWDVSKNGGTPKSSILIGISMKNHPFWGIPIFGNTHMNPTNVPKKTGFGLNG